MNWLDALSDSKPVPPSAPGGNKPVPAPGPAQPGTRPGDDFSVRADWADILLPLGAVLHHEASGGVRYWTRPGKDRRNGYSATTGYADDADRLKVFTSSWPPFADGEVYTKFAAYALVNHGGDYQAAARELGRAGYGSQQPAPASSPAFPAGGRIGGVDAYDQAHADPDVPWPDDHREVRQATVETTAPDPEPPEPLPEIPQFPVSDLVGPLRAFVDWGTKDGLHPECTAVAGLAALVTLAGPARLRLSDVKTIKAILWTALIGVASSGKSPAYEHAFSLIRAAYIKQWEEYTLKEAQWREMAEAEGKKTAGARPVRPEPLELDDVTTEAVARWLIARGEDASGSIVDDELAAFLEGLNQYKGGHGSDLSKWLKLWTGAPLHIKRVASGGSVNEVSLFVSDPVVSISGPLVPENLNLLGKPGSGFRPRWLPFHAPAAPPAWNEAGAYPDEWAGCITTLIENRQSREWSLTGKARARWETARKRWHDQQYQPEPDDVIEALRKADTQALRIALVLAESMNPGAGAEIPAEAVSCAIAIMDYCINVWRALPGNSTMTVSRREDVMDTAHRRLVAWLETRPPSTEGLPEGSNPHPGASRREVQRWLHESPKKLDELIQEHRDRWPGSVVPVKPDHGGRPTIWLYAPPRVSTPKIGAMSPRHRSKASVDPSPEGKTAGRNDTEASSGDVAFDVATGLRQRSATSLNGVDPGGGDLRTIACPSCGEAARSAVEPGEPAWCKHCEAEYIAA